MILRKPPPRPRPWTDFWFFNAIKNVVVLAIRTIFDIFPKNEPFRRESLPEKVTSSTRSQNCNSRPFWSTEVTHFSKNWWILEISKHDITNWDVFRALHVISFWKCDYLVPIIMGAKKVTLISINSCSFLLLRYWWEPLCLNVMHFWTVWDLIFHLNPIYKKKIFQLHD